MDEKSESDAMDAAKELIEEANLIHDLGNRSAPYIPRAKKIGTLVRKLMVSRGISDEQSAIMTQEQWKIAAGPSLAQYTTPGNISRGILYVAVSDNLVLQELHFSKQKILSSLKAALPDFKIRDLKFRIQ